MNSDGFNSNTSYRDGITTDLIRDESDISAIELDATTINFDSFNLTHNGIVIPTGSSSVSNPMITDLDANSKKIINVDRMTVSSIADSSEQRIIDFANAGEIQLYASAKTTINSAEVLLNSIRDYDTSASIIDFTVPDEITLSAPVNINLDAPTIKINANDVLVNPLQQDIDANLKTFYNVERMTVNNITNLAESLAINFDAPGEIQVFASAKTTINSAEVLLNSIKDYNTSASTIDFTTPDEITLSAPVNINIDAATVKINTNTVLTTSNGVSKTMDSTLNANNKNIENANVITTDSIGNATLSEAFYFNVPNQITIGTNNLTRMIIANASTTFTTPILESLGTVGAPTYSFTGDTNTGMYSAGADQLGFTTGGTNRILITTTNIDLTSTNINYNSRTAQLVDIHSSNNTYAGLTSKVGSSNCTSYGSLSGSNLSGNNNTTIGYNTMPVANNITAIENTALGANALVALTSARSNTAIGNLALSGITTGNYNTSIGRNSGLGITTGVDNICIGTNTNNTGSSASCSQCIVIGNTAQTSSVNNSIVMGHGTQSTISNECVIGNSSCSILRNAGVVCDLGTNNNKFKDLYLSGNMGISGHTITPNGGLYMSTSSGPTITGTGVVNLLNGVSSVGSLAFSSGFPAVSGYRMRFITTLNGVNGDILYLKFLLNAVQILALDVSLSASTNKAGMIELEFYITTLSATVGVVSMLASYQYDDAGTIKGDTSNILYSTLNTTIAQPLTITAAFNTAAAGNSIVCTRAMLNKVY